MGQVWWARLGDIDDHAPEEPGLSTSLIRKPEAWAPLDGCIEFRVLGKVAVAPGLGNLLGDEGHVLGGNLSIGTRRKHA